jgi:cobalt-zinc-cadmium efflux system outer membrane protein
MMSRALVCLLVAACAPTQAELRRPVDRDIAARMGEPMQRGTAKGIEPLLGRPIDRDSAVKIALANSPRLSAALAELGVAGGELATAIGLGPLDLDASAKFGPDGLAEGEIEAIQNVIGLITAPRRRAAARAGIAAALALATATALRLAAQTEIAFNDLIAAQQELELRRTAFDAADAAAIVRERMHAAGNTSDLAQARDRDAREQARLDLGRAEASVEIRRERLNALLGLSGDQTKWTTAGTLGEPPASAPSLDDLEAAAVAASLELAAGRARVTAADNQVGAENVRAWLPELGVGVAVGIHDDEYVVGPAVRIGIPLFDNRSGARATARAARSRAEYELTATAIELRANARAARVAALAAYQEARHLREVVLPLRQQIVDQTLLHYNAMDASPFELIVARRQLADGGQQYLDALRRYWNAISEVTALRRGVALEMTTVPDRSSSGSAAPADNH